MPNLEVKRCNADGSVGNPHVRVGHRQVLNERGTLLRELSGVFLLVLFYISYFGFYFGASFLLNLILSIFIYLLFCFLCFISPIFTFLNIPIFIIYLILRQNYLNKLALRKFK